MLHALHRSIATADLTLTHYPPRPLRYLTGILFSLLLALAAIWLSHQPALAALGLTTRFSALKQTGLKPLLLGALLFGWLIIGAGAINLVFQHLLT